MLEKGTYLYDILFSWFEIKNIGVNIDQNNNIGKEIVWNNRFLKIANKTFYYKKWYEQGIKYIQDLYNPQTKHWYNFIDLTSNYDIPPSDFLIFMSLIACIPPTWKNDIETQLNNINIHNVNNNDTNTYIRRKITKVKQANQFLYLHQLKNEKPENITSQEKWSSIFDNLNGIPFIQIHLPQPSM